MSNCKRTLLKTHSKAYGFQTGFQQCVIWYRKAIQNPSGFEQLSYTDLYNDDGIKK
jgi:hypothetical protein